MRNAIRIAPIALLLACGAALSAQSAPKAQFGIAATLVNPMGETADIAGMGFGVGLFYETPFGQRLAVRGTAEYTTFGAYELGTVEFQLNQIGVVADALFHFDAKRSFYGLAGAGFYSKSLDATSSTGAALASYEIDSGVSFGVGAGWKFHESFGVEAKYILGDKPWVQASVIWRL
jgi:hypothetical protein